MSRPARVWLGVAAVGLVGLGALGLLGLSAVMPSYLAAWLMLLALPAGALPVVMGLDLLDLLGLAEASPLMPVLRRLLVLMPLAALLALPVLLRARGLYPMLGEGAGRAGLPGWWMTPAFFLVRAVVILAIWTGLALLFARRPRPVGGRAPLAILGLILHVALGTFAAVDWTQAVEPGFTSSAAGLSLMVAQSGIAVSLAVALVAGGRPNAAARAASASETRHRAGTSDHLALSLLILLAVWGFLVFTQYLVVWSANLPAEVSWYRHRAAGLGRASEDAAVLVCAMALLCLLPRGLARRSGLLAAVAGALALLHGIEMFWLVTPAFRAEFSVTLADFLAFAGLGGLGIGAALLLGGWLEPERAVHGA